MAIFSRTKRVTDPLEEDAKARIFHHHQSCTIPDQDSPPLSELVHSFLEEDGSPEDTSLQTSHNSDTDENSECSDEEIVRMAVSFSDSDPYRNLLLAHVLRTVEAYSGLRSRKNSVFVDKVASFLQELGHDAAVCVSKWNSSAKLNSGSYEFIDVVYKPADDRTAVAVRYVVDLDFASKFEIARPTRQYTRVFQLLPRVFVGREESLRTVVRESCEAARRSLKSCGLSVPPWRRSSYLQQKWFGPYKRRVGSSLGVTAFSKDAVSCRSMGFDDAVNARLFIRT
ncbi:hypothetical protein EUTSA_v10002988mg [Eutrema salsugineum]|uniref:Plant-specific domain TIGR01615 family protein n=1 Tax=Eutrema salsugineum TaxID=72664 RepID=V4LBE7_EUTSA|nr:uncharacterized protein LOC18014156 [Eutrema salsugineum]ESQ37078.1 hypothetical protein EUTSA_v10002988mg [Eutrema salsugineum]